jgi:hypothetical protein
MITLSDILKHNIDRAYLHVPLRSNMGSQGIVFMILVSIGLIQLQMDHSGGYFLTAWSLKNEDNDQLHNVYTIG